MAGNEPTIGEIGRVLERVEAAILSQGEMLNDIRIQTTRTNGRVDRHDDQLRDLESTVVWAWRLIVGTIITTVVVWMIRK
jgi:hypothetical protein